MENADLVLGKEFLTLNNFLCRSQCIDTLSDATMIQSGFWPTNLWISSNTLFPVLPGMFLPWYGGFYTNRFRLFHKEENDEQDQLFVVILNWIAGRNSPAIAVDTTFFFINFWLFVTINTVLRFLLPNISCSE